MFSYHQTEACCLPGHTVETFPAMTARIADEGHEIGHHGWTHRRPDDIYAEGGVRRFYSGIVPRTLWISCGGCVFFGSYETVRELLVCYQQGPE